MDATNDFIDAIIEKEKEEFRPGLESFQMHANRVRQELTDSVQQFETQLENGFATIAKSLEEQGVALPAVNDEALAIFDDPAVFQKALEQGKAIYELLQFSPETLKQFFEVGLELVKKSDFAKAKDLFYFLVTIAPQTSAFWLGLGFCNEKLGFNEEAQSAFRQVIDLDPTNGNAYTGYIRALLKKNLKEEALKVCENGLAVAIAQSQEPWAEGMKKNLLEVQQYLKSN